MNSVAGSPRRSRSRNTGCSRRSRAGSWTAADSCLPGPSSDSWRSRPARASRRPARICCSVASPSYLSPCRDRAGLSLCRGSTCRTCCSRSRARCWSCGSPARSPGMDIPCGRGSRPASVARRCCSPRWRWPRCSTPGRRRRARTSLCGAECVNREQEVASPVLEVGRWDSNAPERGGARQTLFQHSPFIASVVYSSRS